MWSELVEMVEQRCLSDRLPRQRQAAAAVLLYGSLMNCEEAFRRYKQTQSEIDLANAAFAIDSFFSTLHNIGFIIPLFDPALEEKLATYALEESRIAYIAKPKALLKTQVELLRSIVSFEVEILPLSVARFKRFHRRTEKTGPFYKVHFLFP